MATGTEVTIAGKRYANAAAYIQAILGSIRNAVDATSPGSLEVTVRPDEKLEVQEIEALQ
jgi:signal transduction histidine kinase